MSPPDWLHWLCVGGDARGFDGFNTWTCARCFGMLLGAAIGLIVLIAWRSAWSRVAAVWLIASAILNALQHWSASDLALLRAGLGFAFGFGWSGVMLGAMSAELRVGVAGVALGLLIAGAFAWVTGPAWLSGFVELGGYGLMLGSLVLAACCWVRVTVAVDDDSLAPK